METRIVAWYVRLTLALEALATWLLAPGRRLAGQRGQATVEYAVVALIVVVAAIASLQLFTNGVTAVFQKVVSRIQGL